jgi:hypothetical protein
VESSRRNCIWAPFSLRTITLQFCDHFGRNGKSLFQDFRRAPGVNGAGLDTTHRVGIALFSVQRDRVRDRLQRCNRLLQTMQVRTYPCCCQWQCCTWTLEWTYLNFVLPCRWRRLCFCILKFHTALPAENIEEYSLLE